MQPNQSIRLLCVSLLAASLLSCATTTAAPSATRRISSTDSAYPVKHLEVSDVGFSSRLMKAIQLYQGPSAPIAGGHAILNANGQEIDCSVSRCTFNLSVAPIPEVDGAFAEELFKALTLYASENKNDPLMSQFVGSGGILLTLGSKVPTDDALPADVPSQSLRCSMIGSPTKALYVTYSCNFFSLYERLSNADATKLVDALSSDRNFRKQIRVATRFASSDGFSLTSTEAWRNVSGVVKTVSSFGKPAPTRQTRSARYVVLRAETVSTENVPRVTGIYSGIE